MASFAPTVLIDGQTVTPPGWMWVLAYAAAGCKWAMRECETDAWKAAVRQWMSRKIVGEIKEEEQGFNRRRDELLAQLNRIS
jgi:hypothetical protein